MKKRIISKEELTNAIKISLTLGDVISILKIPENGKSRNKIKFLASEYGLDISNLNPNAKRVLRIKYPKIEKKCIACNVAFFTKLGGPKEANFCSYLCSNSHRAKPKTEEEKKKISEGVKISLKAKSKKCKPDNKKFSCLGCNKEFLYHKKKIYCSTECMCKSEVYRNNLRKAMKQRVESGTHSGWKSRKGKTPSYPEKFFMSVLDKNQIKYEHELPCGKYFIDFAIKDKMIALEIDGKQHEYEDRKKSDLLKDVCLSENGWKVYRIKWKSINNESGKIYIKEQIDKFLDFFGV